LGHCFHGDNTGSNSVGDANYIQALTRFGRKFSCTSFPSFSPFQPTSIRN
jgi:hypothetical protein